MSSFAARAERISVMRDPEITVDPETGVKRKRYGYGSGGAGVYIFRLILDEVYDFLGRFVAYPSDFARIAHALWIIHAHLMEFWESTPRLAFLSPEPSSGKTRCLEVTELLVPRPVEAVNVTTAYLFRKISDEDGPPTILYDEADTVFGPKAKANEEIRGLINAGHRRGAVAGRCVVKGNQVSTEELPAYCAVCIAGLGDLPETILTRSVIVPMRRRRRDEEVEPYRRRIHAPEGEKLRDRIAAWAKKNAGRFGGYVPQMPDGVTDRNADVWEPLLAVADIVGGEWPAKARVSCVSLVSASVGTQRESLRMRLLSDIRDVWEERKKSGYTYWNNFSTKLLIEKLVAIPESPWGDINGKQISDLMLARLLRDFSIKSKQVRVAGDTTLKGYSHEDFVDAWERYLSPLPASVPPEGETGET
jgi:hypothetical protein